MLYIVGPHLQPEWVQPAMGDYPDLELTPIDEDHAQRLAEHKAWTPGVQHQAVADYVHRALALGRSPMASTSVLYIRPEDQVLLASYFGPPLHPEAQVVPPQATLSYYLIKLRP